MHIENDQFIRKIIAKFPSAFRDAKALGIGTFDVVGSEGQYFSGGDYQGLDLMPGKGVDIVCAAQDYDAADNTYDTIISSECFEHNIAWKETLHNAHRMLKHGGLLVITCATTGRKEHGTARMEAASKLKYPHWKSMPNVLLEGIDNDYYQNLTEADFMKAIDLDEAFEFYEFEINEEHSDLYFYGFKR